MARYTPLFIDFSGRRVVIFGGGKVGERKAGYFAGADVTVVSREFTPGLEAIEGVRRVRRDVAAGDVPDLIAGAFLVVAATGDRRLDEEIVKAAAASGVLANSAGGDGDVILPSKMRRGDITVAFATGGKSPAMSRFLRLWLEESLGPEMADMVKLQSELREALKRDVPTQDERERLLWSVIDDLSVWEALRSSYDEALAMALDKVKKKIDK